MAHKILFLIPELRPSGAARQLTLLAQALPRQRFQPRIGVLYAPAIIPDSWRVTGVDIEILGSARLFDLRLAWRLCQLLQSFQPDIIHAWQAPALRAIALCHLVNKKQGRSRKLPVVVSAAGPLRRKQGPSWLDQWLLRGADRVVAGGAAEAEALRRLALAAEKMHRIPPGVAGQTRTSNGQVKPSAAAKALPLSGPTLPPGARLLMCAGPLEPHKGFQDAIWAFDILRYLYDDLHLLFVGEGSDRPRLEEFVRVIDACDRVHLAGYQDDVPGWLARAEIVLVPTRTSGGVNVALEAMAAGRPVVASRVADLAEIVAHGETGFLVPPGDKAALARQARMLLDNAGLRDRLGAAARQRAELRFAVPRFIEDFMQLYEAAISGQASAIRDGQSTQTTRAVAGAPGQES